MTDKLTGAAAHAIDAATRGVIAAVDRSDPWTRLAHLWPLLAATRHPGTRRPWRPSELTPARRAELDERERQHRDERLADPAKYPPGLRWLAGQGVIFASRHAPLQIDVLDKLIGLWADLLAAADDLHGKPVNNWQKLMPTPLHDPRQLLEWCRQAARTQPDGIVADRAAWDMLHVIEAALAEIWNGQPLQADCPWCHGGIERKPSWRIRLIPGGRNPRTGKREDMPVIVCESGTCEPPEADTGIWWRGNPAWALWEWEWLADQVEADSRRAS